MKVDVELSRNAQRIAYPIGYIVQGLGSLFSERVFILEHFMFRRRSGFVSPETMTLSCHQISPKDSRKEMLSPGSLSDFVIANGKISLEASFFTSC